MNEDRYHLEFEARYQAAIKQAQLEDMIMKEDKHMQKHNSLCRLLKQELIERGYYTEDQISLNEPYDRGEVDVWVRTPNREIYFEVKSNNHYKNRKKALEQTIRWEKYYKKRNKNKPFYGVYHTPQKTMIISKDGKRSYRT